MSKQNTNVEQKAKKEDKKITVVSVLKNELISAKHKDVANVSKQAFETLKQAGQTHNTRGKEIKLERVKSLCNAMLRDIKQKRNGWWSNFEAVQDEKVVKIVAKK